MENLGLKLGRIVAVIPARGGSKGIKDKNIRDLNGHPLIAYSVAAALECPLVDRVICSTDSEQIAAVAKKYGAEVPFMRPSELAQDDSRDYEVFEHVIHWLKENENYTPNIMVQLRPTSPLRETGVLEKAIETLIATPEADSVRSVSIPDVTPYKMWCETDSGELKPLLQLDGTDEPFNAPRQSLPVVYAQTGTYDLFKVSSFIEYRSMTGKSIYPIIMERANWVDIDDEAALRMAANLLSSGKFIQP